MNAVAAQNANEPHLIPSGLGKAPPPLSRFTDNTTTNTPVNTPTFPCAEPTMVFVYIKKTRSNETRKQMKQVSVKFNHFQTGEARVLYTIVHCAVELCNKNKTVRGSLECWVHYGA